MKSTLFTVNEKTPLEENKSVKCTSANVTTHSSMTVRVKGM